MNRHFKWVVFDNENLVAAFVFRDDADQFIEQCGCGSMHRVSAGASRTAIVIGHAMTRAGVKRRERKAIGQVKSGASKTLPRQGR